MVTLYHGTTIPFAIPDLSRSRKGMDFGSGFYATPNRESAARWAAKTSRLRRGVPTVLAFRFDEEGARAAGLVKDFPVMNRDWVRPCQCTYQDVSVLVSFAASVVISKRGGVCVMSDEAVRRQLRRSAIAQLIEWVMKKENVSLPDATKIVYDAKLYNQIEDEETGLYREGPVYLYDMLCEERGTKRENLVY